MWGRCASELDSILACGPCGCQCSDCVSGQACFISAIASFSVDDKVRNQVLSVTVLFSAMSNTLAHLTLFVHVYIIAYMQALSYSEDVTRHSVRGMVVRRFVLNTLTLETHDETSSPSRNNYVACSPEGPTQVSFVRNFLIHEKLCLM